MTVEEYERIHGFWAKFRSEDDFIRCLCDSIRDKFPKLRIVKVMIRESDGCMFIATEFGKVNLHPWEDLPIRPTTVTVRGLLQAYRYILESPYEF